MTLTVGDCTEYIRQVLGAELSSELSETTLVNQAGEHLTQMHRWRWLERPQTWLNVRGNITFTACTVAQSTSTATATVTPSTGTPFSGYSRLEGDWLEINTGSSSTEGHYRVISGPSTGGALTISGTPGSSTGVAGTVECDAVALPSDFVELIAYTADNGLTNTLELTTLQRIQELRRNEIQVSSRHYFGALTWATPVGGGTPVQRLEIYPHSTSDRAEELVINYRAGWVTVSSDSDQLTLPDWCENLYIQVLRNMAQGYEEYDEASMQQRLTAMQTSPEFLLARRKDGQGQPNYGYLRVGAAGMTRAGQDRYLRSPVQGPS